MLGLIRISSFNSYIVVLMILIAPATAAVTSALMPIIGRAVLSHGLIGRGRDGGSRRRLVRHSHRLLVHRFGPRGVVRLLRRRGRRRRRRVGNGDRAPRPQKSGSSGSVQLRTPEDHHV